MSFLTDLYVKKGWSLRRISRELGCSKNLVRKKLIGEGIEIVGVHKDENLVLKRKIKCLRERGMSYQRIAELLNLWKIGTASRKGKWYAKTVREVCIE